MNEVNNVRLVAPNVLSPASSQGAVEAKKPDTVSKVQSDEVVSDASETQAEAATVSPQVLQAELARVNEFVQAVQRDLQFSVDEDSDQTVIRVVDGDSGELIRQIPEDIFLELARRLNENGEVNLLNAVG